MRKTGYTVRAPGHEWDGRSVVKIESCDGCSTVELVEQQSIPSEDRLIVRIHDSLLNSGTTSTTFERISSISPQQVQARILHADQRVRAAANSMIVRFLRRSEDGVFTPSDLQPPPLPAVPAAPDAVVDMFGGHVSIWHLTTHRHHDDMTAIHRDSIFRINPGLIPAIEVATPEQIVAAITAADRYADELEQLDREYKQTVLESVAAHTRDQSEFVRDLVALVSQIG